MVLVRLRTVHTRTGSDNEGRRLSTHTTGATAHPPAQPWPDPAAPAPSSRTSPTPWPTPASWPAPAPPVPPRDPLAPEQGTRLELSVTGALAATGALMLWAGEAWSRCGGPVLMLVVAACAALWPRGGDAARLARALAVCSAGGVAAVLDPTLAPLALLCSAAAVATYPLVLPPTSARATVGAATAALAVPLLVDLVRGVEFTREVFDRSRATTTFALLGGVGVALALSALTGAAGDSLRVAAAQAAHRARDAYRMDQELTRLATSDPVTGLPNRDALLRRAETAVDSAEATDRRAALLLLEIDRFDTITAGFGPEVGEEVLRQIARKLRASRPADDLVARVDGARFAVLIEEVGPHGCTGAARRAQTLLEEPVHAGGRDLSVTCAIGVALSGMGVDGAEELLRAGEEALHAARLSGRSRWATFDQAMRAHSISQATMELELRDALRRHDVALAFQPIVTLGGRPEGDRVSVVEALARWTRSDGTAVSPQRFVHLAEDLGLGTTLGFQVLDRALEAMATWRAEGAAVAKICINVSRSQLEDPEFAHTVSTRLAARGLPPTCLAMDIGPESLSESEEALRTMGMLRSLGIDLALDDFGRGGTSLTALRRLPLTAVKIDRSVSAELGQRDTTIARSLIGLCHELGLRVIVEGVEEVRQLDAARALGADGAQGYLLGRPARAEEVWANVRRMVPVEDLVPLEGADSPPDLTIESGPRNVTAGPQAPATPPAVGSRSAAGSA